MNETEFRLEPARGRLIRGAVHAPPAGTPLPAPHVLVLHGFKGFMDWGFFPELARSIARAGFFAVRFNMSGSGVGEDRETFDDDEGFATNTVSRELEDTTAVRAFVRGGAVAGVDPERAGLVGHSLGGGVALLHAERFGDYRGIVTWAAVSHFLRFDKATLTRWREEGQLEIPNARTGQVHRVGRAWLDDVDRNAAALDVPDACARLRTPTLLVHGTHDEAVSFREARVLAEAFPADVARLEPLEGAGHTFGAGHPPAWEPGAPPEPLATVIGTSVAWLRRTLGDGPTRPSAPYPGAPT